MNKIKPNQTSMEISKHWCFIVKQTAKFLILLSISRISMQQSGCSWYKSGYSDAINSRSAEGAVGWGCRSACVQLAREHDPLVLWVEKRVQRAINSVGACRW